MKEYALYKGENVIALGTIDEIAKKMGVKKETIAYYKTQAYQNRLRRRNTLNGNVRILVCLDDEEERELEAEWQEFLAWKEGQEEA